MIKAIVFDFGGVVIPGVVLKWVRNLSHDDPKYIFFKEASHKWDLGELSVDEFYEALAKITNKTKDDVKETFYDSAELYPEVLELILQLKHNYKVILFTNNFRHNIEQYFNKLQLDSVFDEVVISSDFKIKKPNHDFYKKLIEITKFQPQEMIFIDDKQENVDAGNQTGIQSILFTGVEKLKKDLQAAGIIL